MLRSPSSQSGFSLVELSIVMVIVGLLIGAVLTGQKVVENSRITSTITQVLTYQTAVKNFKTMYKALPGDMRDPGDRLPNCTTAKCNTAGNGNGWIGDRNTSGANDATYTVPSEVSTFWPQLYAAGMINFDTSKGTATSSANIAFGLDLPSSRFGGGFSVRSWGMGVSSPYTQGIYGNFFTLSAKEDDVRYPGLLSPRIASIIDDKLDDGKPFTGNTIGTGSYGSTSTDCMIIPNYNGTTRKKECNLMFKF